MRSHPIRYIDTTRRVPGLVVSGRPRFPYFRLGETRAIHAATNAYARWFADGTSDITVAARCSRQVSVSRPGLIGLAEDALPPIDPEAGETQPDLWPYCSRCFGERIVVVEWRERGAA